MKKTWLIVGVLALAAAAGYFSWQYWQKLQIKQEPLPTYISEEASRALETAQNPVKNVVETNPFKKEETNPLLNVYKNPFE